MVNEKHFFRRLYVAQLIEKDDEVLDTACSGGSFTHRFCVEKATGITAIDINEEALALASKNQAHPKIVHSLLDALKESSPLERYDMIILNAGITYFSQEQFNTLFEKIVRAMQLDGTFVETPALRDEVTEDQFNVFYCERVYQVMSAFFAYNNFKEYTYALFNSPTKRTEIFWIMSNTPTHIQKNKWREFNNDLEYLSKILELATIQYFYHEKKTRH